MHVSPKNKQKNKIEQETGDKMRQCNTGKGLFGTFNWTKVSTIVKRLNKNLRQACSAFGLLVLFGFSTSIYAASTTTTLATTPTSSAVVGANVTLKATVSGIGVTGTVTFKDGATIIGTGTLSGTLNATASISTTFSTAGTHSLTAVYNGNSNYTGSTSAVKNLTITQSTTNSNLAANPSTAAIGSSVALTATITGFNPTGTVTFKDGTTTIGTGTLSGSGNTATATYNATFTTVASHSITAVYAGDTNNMTSSSGAKTVTVTKATSTAAVSSSLSTAVIGQGVTLTATINGYTPTGTVTFKDGATTLGTGTLSGSGNTVTATLNTSFSTAGSHSLTAVYGGDTNNNNSTSAANTVTVITTAPTTTTLSAAPSATVAGQAVTLTATVNGYTPTGTVTFKDGSTTLGTGTLSGSGATATATFNASFSTVGSHNITATYEGDTNDATSASATSAVAITAATTTTSLSNPGTATVGANVVLTATVNGYTPTGTVTFKEGTTVLGTGTLSGSGASTTATLTTTFTTVGTHTITATYEGDANDTASTASASTITINAAATSTTLTVPSSAAAVTSVPLTATVSGYSATGTVTFKEGTTVLGTAALSGSGTTATATYNASFNTTGAHTITAVYAGDSNNTNSTSGNYSITITPAISIVTLTANPTTVAAGTPVTVTVNVTGASPTGHIGLNGASNITGTGDLVNGSTTFTITFNSVGPQSINAVYGGDANNNAGNSDPVAITVNIASTTTNLTVTPNPATVNQSVLLKAALTGSGPNVSGTVTFQDGNTTIGSGTVTQGVLEYNAVFSTAGTHNITAVYSGDTNNSISTSAPIALVINVAPTSTVLTAPASAIVGDSVTLTAAVNDFAPPGTVTFKDGTTELGTATLSNGVATLNTTFSTAGSHTLTAVYSGDANYAASTSAAISINISAPNQAPTVSLTAPAANQNFTAPANITISATATDSDGSIDQVKFYDGTTLLGVGTQQGGSSTYTFNWNNVAIGSYTLTAIAMDNQGLAANSAPVQITVSSGVAQVYYIHTDQLDTPRLITNQANTPVWRWDSTDPFANNPVNDDPNSTNNHFTFNQRFPGQYYDKETNTHYNYFRDYDPATGRYIESDPIGLAGGINTYGYVGGNPVSWVDPMGLARCYLIFLKGKGTLHCDSDYSSDSLEIPIASGNNGDGSTCKNNSNCESKTGQGPIPRGWWEWTGDFTKKPNGRALSPLSGTNSFNRSLIRSHSCKNPFGPSVNAPFCSEGCVTGTPKDIKALNKLLDSEPNSRLYVTDKPYWE